MAVEMSETSVNPCWHVPYALLLLRGIEPSAKLLIDEADKLLEKNLAGQDHPETQGVVAAAVVSTAWAAEFALKTLLAQTRPTEKPHGHSLVDLFEKLEPEIQVQAQTYLEDQNVFGEPDSDPDLRDILVKGSRNFVDWRYIPERQHTDSGVPWALLNVTRALKNLCVVLVQAQQEI